MRQGFEIGNYYHLYNRGVDKRKIFMHDNDRWRFLQGLCLFNDVNNSSHVLWQLERNRGKLTMNVLLDHFRTQNKERDSLVRILAYCLMPNHFHILVQEIREGGISQFMKKLGGGYTGYINSKYKRSGSLFQGKFKYILVDNEQYLQYLLVYINVINPGQLFQPKLKKEGVKNMEKLLEFVDAFPWSTHQEYTNRRNSIIMEKELFEEMLTTTIVYHELVDAVLRERKYEEIQDFALED